MGFGVFQGQGSTLCQHDAIPHDHRREQQELQLQVIEHDDVPWVLPAPCTPQQQPAGTKRKGAKAGKSAYSGASGAQLQQQQQDQAQASHQAAGSEISEGTVLRLVGGLDISFEVAHPAPASADQAAPAAQTSSQQQALESDDQTAHSLASNRRDQGAAAATGGQVGAQAGSGSGGTQAGAEAGAAERAIAALVVLSFPVSTREA